MTQPAGRERDYSRLIYGPGTAVRIVHGKRKHDERGILLTSYDAHPNWTEGVDVFFTVPRLMLCVSRKKLWGFECWWIPEEEVHLPAAGDGALRGGKDKEG